MCNDHITSMKYIPKLNVRINQNMVCDHLHKCLHASSISGELDIFSNLIKY